MNTKTRILSFVVMFAVAILVGSCKKDSILDPFSNCDKLANDFSNAYQAYISNPSQATCEAFVDAYEDYLNGCSGWIGWNPVYDHMLDDVDCSEEGQ